MEDVALFSSQTMKSNLGLEVHELNAGYGRIQILHKLSLQAAMGSTTLVLGANGSGKSTLVKAILGRTRLNGGSIRFQGENIYGKGTSEITNSGIAIVPEGRRLFSELTVVQNLEVALYSQKLYRDSSKRRSAIDQALQMFPALDYFRDIKVGSLSGGQQQMVSVARALVRKPRFLILDEPSAGLAPKIIREVLTTVTELSRSEGIGVLLVEQSTLALDMGVSSKIYVVSGGRVVREGSPSEVTRSEIDDAYFE